MHISENENQKLLDQIIGKNIKPTGIQNMLILVEDSTFIEKILTSFKNTMMFIKGYGFVLSSNGIYGKLENGLLICVEKGLENASSYEEYEFLAIKNILDIIFAYEGEMEILINYLEKKTHNHHLKPEFSIINIQNTEKIIIGSIYSDLSIYEKPMSVMTTENQNLDYSNNIEMYSTSIFPGDSLDIPNSKINITISIANGIKDPGYPDTYLVKLIKLGCLYAIRIAQNSGILSNFNINVQDTNCGATVYNQTYSLPCYSENKPKLGAVFLSSPIDSMCVGTLQDFRILNIPIPIISDRCSTPILSDKTLVPEFMRIIAPGSFASGVIASLTTIFGWKNVAVFSSTF